MLITFASNGGSELSYSHMHQTMGGVSQHMKLHLHQTCGTGESPQISA